MVLKTTNCRFSGLRIWPGRGLLFIRVDGQQYLFLNKKCKSHFHNRKRPAKLAWTTTYRKAHKKDQVAEASRKKRRTISKVRTRAHAPPNRPVQACLGLLSLLGLAQGAHWACTQRLLATSAATLQAAAHMGTSAPCHSKQAGVPARVSGNGR